MNILVISSIFRINELSNKKDENDIIVVTNDSLNEYNVDYNFIYIFPALYVNKLMSFFSNRYREIYKIIKKGKIVSSNNNIINVFPILRISRFKLINKLLMDLSFYFNSKKYYKFLTDNKIDLIHAHSVASDGYLAYKLYKYFKIPYILTVRELNKNNFDDLIVKNAEKLITLNGVDFNLISTKYNIQSNLIPHGIDKRFYKDFEKNNINKKLKFLSVCRLIKLKNLDKVIYALNKINFEFEFDIYGVGPEMENLQKIINDLRLNNKIKLRGKYPYDKIDNLYSKYDLFLMPSKPEALGRVYFESMASGTPVIACKDTGIDGLIENKVEGYLIEDDSITTNIINILNSINADRDKLFKVSKNARKFVEKYTWESVLLKLDTIYRK